MQMYGKFEDIPPFNGVLVWVGNIVTPVKPVFMM